MSTPTNRTIRKPKQRKLLKVAQNSGAETCLRCGCTFAEHSKPTHAVSCGCDFPRGNLARVKVPFNEFTSIGFQRRPCECGHGHSAHDAGGVCTARLDKREAERQRREVGGPCGCKAYRFDRSPAFLLQAGIHSGEWQFLPVAQLEKLMHPDSGFGFKTRVWACGMVHTIGVRRHAESAIGNSPRLAVKITSYDDKGDPQYEPFSPHDFVDELNALDPIGRATDQNVRKALAELEQDGIVRRVGKFRLNVRVYFYLRPLTEKQVPPEDPDLLGESDQQKNGSTSKESQLDTLIMHYERVVCKSFWRTAREIFAAEAPGLLVNSDQQKQLDVIADELALLVKNACQNVVLLVRSERAYKEVSTLSTEEEQSASSLRSLSVIQEAETTEQPPTISGPQLVRKPEANPENEQAGNAIEGPDHLGKIVEQLAQDGIHADDEGIRKLLALCQEVTTREGRDPATGEEVAFWLHTKAQEARSAKRSPMGLLLTAVPKCFEGKSFQLYRDRQRAVLSPEAQAAALAEAQAQREEEMAYQDARHAWIDQAFSALSPRDRAGMMADAEKKIEAQGRLNKLDKSQLAREKALIVRFMLGSGAPTLEQWREQRRQQKTRTAGGD